MVGVGDVAVVESESGYQRWLREADDPEFRSWLESEERQRLLRHEQERLDAQQRRWVWRMVGASAVLMLGLWIAPVGTAAVLVGLAIVINLLERMQRQ